MPAFDTTKTINAVALRLRPGSECHRCTIRSLEEIISLKVANFEGHVQQLRRELRAAEETPLVYLVRSSHEPRGSSTWGHSPHIETFRGTE